MALHQRQVGVVAMFAMVAIFLATLNFKSAPSAGLATASLSEQPGLQEVAAFRCVDSDGNNAQLAGTAELQYVTDARTVVDQKVDTCVSATAVRESTCAVGADGKREIALRVVSCSTGQQCLNGACVALV